MLENLQVKLKTIVQRRMCRNFSTVMSKTLCQKSQILGLAFVASKGEKNTYYAFTLEHIGSNSFSSWLLKIFTITFLAANNAKGFSHSKII